MSVFLMVPSVEADIRAGERAQRAVRSPVVSVIGFQGFH